MPCASCCGLLRAGGRLRTEDLDHADDRAEQAQQRCRRGDRAQRVQVALEPVQRNAPGVFEGLAHGFFGDARFGNDAAQSGGADAAEHRVRGQLVDHVDAGQAGSRDGDDLIQQLRRRDRSASQVMSRSMMRVRATMEHRTSGQIGQPAACMIESKGVLGRLSPPRPAASRRPLPQREQGTSGGHALPCETGWVCAASGDYGPAICAPDRCAHRSRPGLVCNPPQLWITMCVTWPQASAKPRQHSRWFVLLDF